MCVKEKVIDLKTEGRSLDILTGGGNLLCSKGLYHVERPLCYVLDSPSPCAQWGQP